MKKLIVKDDVCIGCGACVAIDSLHFDLNENGLSSVISNENVETGEVITAINTCPVNAIKLVDEDHNEVGQEDGAQKPSEDAPKNGCACDNCEHCAHHEDHEA